MQIEILDAIECQVSRADGELLFPCLSFESVYWKQGPFKRQRKTYQKSVFSFKGKEFWRFYTGLLPRIRQWCVDQGIPLEIVGEEIAIPRQNPPFLKGIGFKEFREDQLKLIDVACSAGRGVIEAATGVGKTLMQLGIMSCYPKSNILLLAHTTGIISQTFQELKRFGFKDIEMYGAGNKIEIPKARITISTMQSWIKLDPKYYIDRYDCCIVDECLSPDTEILTTNGWKLIKDLEDEKVAQYNQTTRHISFVKPTKKIAKWHKGNLIRFYNQYNTDLLGTPLHEQPYFITASGYDTIKKQSFKDWKASGSHSYPTAGFIQNNRELTNMDRFKIMTAADGRITHRPSKEHHIIQFSFSKERKINRFKQIVNACGYNYNEVKPTKKKANVKLRRRFLVRAPHGITKNLYAICPIEKVSLEFVNDFIAELVQWDGSTKHNILYWSGTNKKDADYIQAICSLAGVTVSHNIQKDNRKDTYNDMHRMVFILDKDLRCCQSIQKTIIPYDNMVYCVRVPDSNIVIRRNNRVMITGNCHHIQKQDSTYATILSHLLSPIRLGFTATVRTNKEAQLISEGLLGPVIGRTTIEEAAELNILATPKLRLIKAKCNPDILDLRKYQDVYEYGIVSNKLRNNQIAEITKEFYDKEMTTLIFVTQIEHGLLLVDLLEDQLNCKVPFVRGEMPEEQRTKVKKELISNKIKVVIATTSWREGVDVPSLSAVVLGGGGKSEIQTLQGIGRGLRKTKDKDEVIVVDFLDLTHFHLTRQTGERLAIYSENSWL